MPDTEPQDPAAEVVQDAVQQDAAGDDVALQTDVAATEDQIAQLQSRCDRLDEELGAANAALATITAGRDALKAEAEKAAAAPKAKTAAVPKTRKLGPLKDDQALEPGDLLELIKGAKLVEVAFSDGKKEIAGLPALEVSGDAWAVGVTGLILRGVVPEVVGPPQGHYEIAGYALLIDGDQAAWHARSEVLAVHAGHRMSLAGDVVF